MIHYKLYTLLNKGHYENRAKVQQYQLDVEFIKMFCMCHQAWEEDYSAAAAAEAEADEQGKEISLKSIIIHLKKIWVEEDLETWPKDIQDFDPVPFGLERKIQQSKPLIKQWCQLLVRSSSMQMQIQCKSSTDHKIMKYFVDSVLNNVYTLVRYKGAAEIGILKEKLEILFHLVSIVYKCGDSKELVEYRNFVHAFFNNAACLVCLYWAKEDNEETETEMNIALFRMLHKIQPCAADVTVLYFRVLKSNSLRQSHEYNSQEQIIARFVDFFFEHTILKDDFLILREQLIVVFTFLTDAPHQNGAAEEDLICTQIYALFREDSYLLLSKEDPYNKKMLLSDFMIKIEKLNANIIHLYCRPSESWHRLETEIMNNIYFTSIARELSLFKQHAHLYLKELRFLMLFFQCFETWDDSNEETRVRLSSMVASLQRIWGQKYDMRLLSGRLYAIRKLAIADWQHLLDSELKQKFQMSKKEINTWLVSLSQCSFHCRPSTGNKTLKFLDSIFYNMTELVNSGACKDVAFEKQIDILKDKLEFLFHLVSRVRECIDSKELVEYRNFVLAFSNNAACLVCLYSAKEANEETETEMNIALFHMLHKFRPCAADVTVLYFRVLKSTNFLQSLQPHEYNSQVQTLARFVDFFFKHTILKDDFLILREQLIVVLTFLTDAPHENAAADLICTQIYDLFRKDAYLLLSYNEMKKDLSMEKMRLSDFMFEIHKLNAKIKRLHSIPSDSWTILEAEKMNNIYFASLERELSSIKQHAKRTNSKHPVLDQVRPYLMEIRLLRLFIQCFETWDDSDKEINVRLSSMITSLQSIWGQEFDMELLIGRLYGIRIGDKIAEWEHPDLELQDKFQTSKQEINAWLVSLSHCSFHCRPSTSVKTLEFMDSIFYNMTKLVNSGACEHVVFFKKQIEILEEKLLLLKNLLKLTTNCANSMNLEDFNMLVQVFANNAACLIYLNWAEEANGKNLVETNLMLSNMIQKIKPNTTRAARIYIGALKDICLQTYDSILLEQTATSFVDYFFEDMVIPWKNEFQILRDEVIFYLTFVHHHHTCNVEEIICSQLDVLFSEGVYGLLPFDDMKGDLFKKNVGLSNFLMNTRTENAKIKQLHCKFSDSFVYNFPRIIGHGFLDRLLRKLRNMTERMVNDQKYLPFEKYKIMMTMEKELVNLTPIFNQFLELKELNDAWLEVVNVLYLAEHVIGLCFIFYHQICHYIPYLSDIVDRVKAVWTNLEKIEEWRIYNEYTLRCLPHSAGFMSTLLEDWTSEVVGFELDEKIIIDKITRGTKSLDIVSIVGMGGSGKTTLAKMVYGSSLVRSHFNIFAFTYVSQDHDKRKILLDILRDVVGVGPQTSCMTEDDLAHKLRKCLSRQKYFIVLDDIWDINAWDEIRSSFPNDQNGSRVMFTTRSLEVAKRGQINCSPHRLRFLTEDESLELLRKKVFHNDISPPNFSSVLKLISKKCSGLPLAIVVLANLLARTETIRWIDISERVSSYLFDEGCMNILEISYKDLPEYLKACILYLGAFPMGSSYRVNEVTLLWIDEGFIKESKTKSLNDVAKEYLYELVDRGLIIVDKMTIGDIRTFRVNDLIHDLCQKKCREENFVQLGHGTATSRFSASCNLYRVSVQNLRDITGDVEPSFVNTRSVLCFSSELDYSEQIFPLRKFRFVKVLYLKSILLKKSDFKWLVFLIDLRHINAKVSKIQWIPSSISNLSNLQSLILKNTGEIYLPETLWRMKSLRHVEVTNCKFEVSDGCELQLDKVVSFSRPYLSTGKDVEWLLQKLPAVRKLSCILHNERLDSTEELVETFDFHRKLESLKLYLSRWRNRPYLINFPSTLNKLTLERFKLSWTVISAIAEIQCLRIFKLRDVSFPGTEWEMEDVTFPNLKYFELRGSNLELWSASCDSFPCLEQLFFVGTELKEIPSCFEEIPFMKKITIKASPQLESSALRIREVHMEFGNKLELEF